MAKVSLRLLMYWMPGFGAGQAAERANLLLILADDCAYWDVEVCGGRDYIR
jgi:hypothetical protein